MKENVESELRYRLEEKTGDLKEKQLRIKQLEYELFKLEEELEVKHTKQIQLKEKEKLVTFISRNIILATGGK